MFNLFYNFIPIVLFFIAFKCYGIYVATVVGIITTFLQLVISSLRKRRLDKQFLITLLVFLLFGGMTLYFHNPLFIKWKPTVTDWICATTFLMSHFIGSKTIAQRMLEKTIDSKTPIPSSLWTRLNLAWVLFFIGLGGLNLYVAYSFSTDTWVNFKLYGTLGLLLLFTMSQALFLAKYVEKEK